MRQFLALLLTTLFLLSSSGCGAGQVIGPTLTPTLTSTATPTLTPTATATPTPTPIPTPSVDAGLRPENAATQTYENGTWVVKNADGQTTATWNEQTKEWTYNVENIITKQIIVGFDVDPAVIEPFLGPLPPDDPSTHFIDPDTGKRVGYGIGPEMWVTSTNQDLPPFAYTEVFARFRGIVETPLPPEWQAFEVAIVVEVPKTADTSIIIVSNAGGKYVSIAGTPHDSMFADVYTLIGNTDPSGPPAIARANTYLVGQMVAIQVPHDNAYVSEEDPTYDFSLMYDSIHRTLLDYLAGITTTIPSRVEYKYGSIFMDRLIVPESQLPPQ